MMFGSNPFLSMETLMEGGVLPGRSADLSPRLMVIVGQEPGKVFGIGKGELKLGRDESSHILLNDASVSRQHANIYRDESGTVTIKDRNSRNGLYVNELKVDAHRLNHGDILRIGDVLLKYFEFGSLEAEVFQRVFELALYDSVTEIYSRTAITHHLHTLVQNNRSPFGVVMADLDHFKKVNDTYGHLTGDFVLQQAAAAMKKALRKEDFIGRFGGEEFLMLLPDTDINQAASVAEACRKSLQETTIQRHNQEIRITCSFGVTAHLPGETKMAEDVANLLIERADRALYAAKHQGRNCVKLCHWQAHDTSAKSD
ncbi:MAG: diguanylate cyclase domain-containing protein [bacterium]